jgi:protoporphyrinogen oxidase
MASEPSKPKRVCVVGAGAAGLAAAWSLGRYPDKFEVHVYEKDAWAGGVSTSEDIGQGHWINDGVQVSHAQQRLPQWFAKTLFDGRL